MLTLLPLLGPLALVALVEVAWRRQTRGLRIRRVRLAALSLLLASPIAVGLALGEAGDPHSRTRLPPFALAIVGSVLLAGGCYLLLLALVVAADARSSRISRVLRRLLVRS